MKNARMMICLVAAVLFMATDQGFSYVDFRDGGTHNINYQINDTVRVDYDSPGLRTTVNWLNGSNVTGGYYLNAYQDSRINVKGGNTGNLLYIHDRSQITISGGTVWLGAFNSSHVDISGGSVTNADMSDYAQMNLHGGSVAQFGIDGNAKLQMSGGTVTGVINAVETSQVYITGGVINGNLTIDGQTFIHGGDINGELIGLFKGVLWVYGSNFAVDGQSVGYGELTSSLGKFYANEPVRHLTGTLATGDYLDTTFQLGKISKIMLVPEPATLLLFGLGAAIIRKFRN